MKTYLVNASFRVHVHAYVEAENVDQALDIAYDMDGGDFERDRGDDLADWSIDDANEVTK
jgi:hypothetical protein